MNESRATQDIYTFTRCILNIYLKEANKILGVWKDGYMIDGRLLGNLLLKVVLRESGLDTKHTTSHIWSSLASLDVCIKMIKDNIPKFNTYDKGLLYSLNECRETTYNLLVNLAKSY